MKNMKLQEAIEYLQKQEESNVYISVVEYRTCESISSFLESTEDLADRDDFYESVVLSIDRDDLKSRVADHFRDEYSLETLQKEYEDLDDETYKEEKEQLKDYIDRYEEIVEEVVEDITLDYEDTPDHVVLDFFVNELGMSDFEIDDIVTEVRDNEVEGLMYYTVYWYAHRGGISVETAERVGLIVFEYNNTEYLALGGYGMDLSPKLDAYIALKHNTIPAGSKFFSDRSYFEHVVGSDVALEIERKAKLPKPEIHITCY